MCFRWSEKLEAGRGNASSDVRFKACCLGVRWVVSIVDGLKFGSCIMYFVGVENLKLDAGTHYHTQGPT